MRNIVTLLTKRLTVLLLTVLMVACDNSSGEDNSVSGFTVESIACSNNPEYDSYLLTPTSVDVISSFDKLPAPHYGQIITRYDSNQQPVWVDYMVHEATNSNGDVVTAKGLIVLLAGGQLTAYIQGSGTDVISAGGNFVVRSAHLYAQHGYKVVTIDQPSDVAQQLRPLNSGSGYALDTYRTSVDHAVDLSAVINTVNTNLPVYLVGTSRGTISAVAQSALSNGLALSAPVTVGSQLEAFPIKSGKTDPGGVAVPTQIIWHRNDACNKSPPDGARNLANYFAAGAELKGGFNHPDYLIETCGAFVYHGFMGIESCAVRTQSNWLDSVALTGPRPAVPALDVSINTPGGTICIDISVYIPMGGKASLPFATTALNGNVSLTGNNITYTAPAGLANGTDTFVYVIADQAGAVGHNLVNVTIAN